MRIKISGVVVSIILAMANVSCGGGGSGLSFPKDYKGVFTEKIEFRANWGQFQSCSAEKSTTQATLHLLSNGDILFERAYLRGAFQFNRATSECWTWFTEMSSVVTMKGTHDSKGNMQLQRKESWINYNLPGTYNNSEANFTGNGVTENDSWWQKETYSFTGNAI